MCQCEQKLQQIFGTTTNAREEFLYKEILELIKCVCDCPKYELTDDDINRLG